MNPAAGTVEFELGTHPVSGWGASWKAEELDTALSGLIAAFLFDREGTAGIAALLEDLPETDFDDLELLKILDNDTPPRNTGGTKEAVLMDINSVRRKRPSFRILLKKSLRVVVRRGEITNRDE